MWTRLRAEASLAADDLRPRSSPEWALAVFGLTAIALMSAAPMDLGMVRLCAGGGVALAASVRASLATGALANAGGHWALMTAVMAPLLAIQPLRHVLFRSYAWRRGRAAAAFIAGYLLVWLAAGIVPLAAALAAAAVGGDTGVRALGLGLVAAATLWAFAPARHRAVRRCRRTPALAATGPRADRDCLAFGMGQGLECVFVCGPLMAALATLSHGPILTIATGLWLWLERGRGGAAAIASALAAATLGSVALLA